MGKRFTHKILSMFLALAVIDQLTESYETYIDGFTYDEYGGTGYMFIRKMRNGSPQGLGGPKDDDDIYYLVWMLY